MEIRFECECYDRTLIIKFPSGYDYLKKEIEECLEQYYSEWIFMDGPYGEEEIHDMCLEEYMIDRLSEIYNVWDEWYSEED